MSDLETLTAADVDEAIRVNNLEIGRELNVCLSDIFNFNVTMWSLLYRAMSEGDSAKRDAIIKVLEDIAAAYEQSPRPADASRSDVAQFREVARQLRSSEPNPAATQRRSWEPVVINGGK